MKSTRRNFRTGGLAWLRENALFSCSCGCGCEAQSSFHAEDLHLYRGGPVCEGCWDDELSFQAHLGIPNGDGSNGLWSFGDLPPFDPFRNLGEVRPVSPAQRLLAAYDEGARGADVTLYTEGKLTPGSEAFVGHTLDCTTAPTTACIESCGFSRSRVIVNACKAVAHCTTNSLEDVLNLASSLAYRGLDLEDIIGQLRARWPEAFR